MFRGWGQICPPPRGFKEPKKAGPNRVKIYVLVFKNVVSAELDTKWFHLKDCVSQLKLYSQPLLVSTWAGCKGCCITILLLESPLFFRCFVRPTATESTALYIANVWKMLLLSSSVYNVFIIMMTIIIIRVRCDHHLDKKQEVFFCNLRHPCFSVSDC